jgi:hypothetical protein
MWAHTWADGGLCGCARECRLGRSNSSRVGPPMASPASSPLRRTSVRERLRRHPGDVAWLRGRGADGAGLNAGVGLGTPTHTDGYDAYDGAGRVPLAGAVGRAMASPLGGARARADARAAAAATAAAVSARSTSLSPRPRSSDLGALTSPRTPRRMGGGVDDVVHLGRVAGLDGLSASLGETLASSSLFKDTPRGACADNTSTV